jgi:hypothetical protein
MTENQETQIISMLAEAISEIRGIRKKQDDQDKKLDLLIARTGDIASVVINHESRITKVENNVADLQQSTH